MESERPSLAYQIFEKTGEKLYEVYDYVVRNPSLVKISRHKKNQLSNNPDISNHYLYQSKTNRYDEDDDEDYELPIDQAYITNDNENKLEQLERELHELRTQMETYLHLSQRSEDNNKEQNVNSQVNKKIHNSLHSQILAQKVKKPRDQKTSDDSISGTDLVNNKNKLSNDVEEKSIVEKLKTVSSPIVSPEKSLM